ncbi:MAG TPA: 50S ribosomal protein L17 [Alkalispirochaeta sp.]|nr:50S ribosomal protein L17 [Alkalispirochaeta sp.]
MKHKIGYNRLGRKTAHRKAMTRNMLTSLFRHERIRTTKAKALAVRRTAEKMITRAKLDSVHNRRIIGKDIKDSAVLAKMFTEIGPRFKERPGGYTRVLKLGPRSSDAAEMVVLELVPEADKTTEKKASSGKGKKKAAKGTQAVKPADAAVAPETQADTQTDAEASTSATEAVAEATDTDEKS